MATSPQANPAELSRRYDEFLAEIEKFVKSDNIYTDELRTLGWGTDASLDRKSVV